MVCTFKKPMVLSSALEQGASKRCAADCVQTVFLIRSPVLNAALAHSEQDGHDT
jgi:hypothetical protein